MIEIVVFLSYTIFKNMSISRYKSDYLGTGYSYVSTNIFIHLLVLVKLITRVDSLESVGITNTVLIISYLIFTIALGLILSALTSKKFRGKCLYKYKKNELLNTTGGLVFILYFFANVFIAYNIFNNDIALFGYLKFVVLPLLFYIYCKIIARNNIKQSKNN
jgi:ABC-type sugar transport system permease subunit